METIINLHIERLPEGIYLATSDELQGLVAQGRTIAETLEIARDVARKLLEAQSQNHLSSSFFSWLPWRLSGFL
ncbi:MAG: type II toxin-antitoxin system HicB family antitoxin [Rhizonema sp. PD38]|nr:type II toxin-antitoxin system HicB family antitoxin [Rhizonema sp. PD38]